MAYAEAVARELSDLADPRIAASTDWRHLAECVNEDPELWFPIGAGEYAGAREQLAIAICERCPVTAQCLNWALESGQAFGVWGGKTEDQRRVLRAPMLPSNRLFGRVPVTSDMGVTIDE